MVNETYVTIRGYAGGDPVVFVNDAGRASAFVRVGVTHRIYDRVNKRYSDGVTVWYSVRTYGELATNVASSVTKGTPVLARGRLSQRVWTDSGGLEHAENCVFADSFGIELTTGIAQFSKVRSAAAKKMPAGNVSPDMDAFNLESRNDSAHCDSSDGLTSTSLNSYQGHTSYSHSGGASYSLGEEDHGGETLGQVRDALSDTSDADSGEFVSSRAQSLQLQEV